MRELLFMITPEEDGSFSACWDDPLGGGISTQGRNIEDVQVMIKDAIFCHFDEEKMPVLAKLHFAEDPTLSLA